MLNFFLAEKRIRRLFTRTFFTLFGITSFSFHSIAQVENSLTFERALEKSISSNLGLSAFAYKQDYLSGIREDKNLRSPLEVEIELEDFAGNDEFKRFDNAETVISISSVLELGKKRNLRTAVIDARQSKLATQQQLEIIMLSAEVRKRFVRVLAIQESIKLFKRELDSSKKTWKTLESRTKAGATSQIEMLRAEANVYEAQQNLDSALVDFSIAKSHLSLLWSEQTETESTFNQVVGDLFQLGKPFKLSTLDSRLKNSVAFKTFSQQTQISSAELSEQKSFSSPDLKWRIGYKQFHETNENALMLGLSVPLFSGSRAQGKTRASQAKLFQSQIKEKENTLDLTYRVKASIAKHQLALNHAARLQKIILPLLDEALNRAQQAFDSGRYSFLEWQSVQQDVIEANRDLINTSKTALILRADIEQFISE